MVSNFEFLEKDFPVLANFGELAEKYCYSDSNSCLDEIGYDRRNYCKSDVYI